jgi:hypothetical protein
MILCRALTVRQPENILNWNQKDFDEDEGPETEVLYLGSMNPTKTRGPISEVAKEISMCTPGAADRGSWHLLNGLSAEDAAFSSEHNHHHLPAIA